MVEGAYSVFIERELYNRIRDLIYLILQIGCRDANNINAVLLQLVIA
jgi:hypothetical protein